MIEMLDDVYKIDGVKLGIDYTHGNHWAVAPSPVTPRIPLPDQSVDLVFCSPPYGSQRTYGIGFVKSDEEWIQWAADGFMECLRVCKGRVAWVVEGYTHKHRFSPLPELLTAELWKRGANMRQRAIYHRAGIPGGSPDDFAYHHEIIIQATARRVKLPWSDPKATGKPPIYGPGGAMSHRLKDGTRKHKPGRRADGKTEIQTYKAPKKCKASNVIHCKVGGGLLGSPLAHENEAPFPEALVEPFVLSYSKPGDIVLDPFCGSGTTLKVALKHGRRAIGFDVRQSQVDLTVRRIQEEVEHG